MRRFSILLLAVLFVTIGGTAGISINALTEQGSIPTWVKGVAGYWSEGKISEADFIQAIQFLVTQKIITLPNEIPSANAQTTTNPQTSVQVGATGPQGPKGDIGATGAVGQQGPQGFPGNKSFVVTIRSINHPANQVGATQVSCNNDEILTGGGYNASPYRPTISVDQNGPSSDGKSWTVELQIGPPTYPDGSVPQYTAYAMCAKLQP